MTDSRETDIVERLGGYAYLTAGDHEVVLPEMVVLNAMKAITTLRQRVKEERAKALEEAKAVEKMGNHVKELLEVFAHVPRQYITISGSEAIDRAIRALGDQT